MNYFIPHPLGAPIMESLTKMEDEYISNNEQIVLCELLDRLLNKGVVIQGDVTISVANVDLIYLNLMAILTSVETGRKLLGHHE